MMSSKAVGKSLIMILFSVGLASCQNSIPTVVNIGSAPLASKPANSKNFSQLSAASQQQVFGGGYKGTLRISQPLGRLQATTANGHKLQGTVTLQR
jgi:hypothetical protein